jgi:formylmethanofuran dehydrogenase subunit B
VGQSTCTLGEVKQRADVVVFWGCDPLVTHPRFVERYCPPQPGRTVVVVDTQQTETAKAADLFVPVTAGRQWEAVRELREQVTDTPVPLTPNPSPAGGEGNLPTLAHLLRSAKFGVVVFGDGLTAEPLAHRTVESLFQLVTDLNQHTRCYALRLRGYAGVSGAESVLAWQTGYPFGVNFAAGYPRHNSGEFTGVEILARGEPDLCVLVGSEGVDLPPAAAEHLRSIPVIALDPPGVRLSFTPAVRFTTATYGVHRPGTAHRMDEVTIPLRVLTESDYPSDGEVLAELLRRVR